MKKFAFVILAVVFGIYMYGCGKKQVSMEEQEPLSMETLSALSTNQAVSEINVSDVRAEASGSSLKLESLPPTGPYKPRAIEIQTALKNANFYTGAIDGKIGPLSKKSIIEFQKANGLQADGKVGPKTWAALEKYLNPTPKAASAPSQKTR
ncbi:MAG: peptidoglycan-binding domain-containing protein [Candidatus Omnitrophota bacterium]